MKLPVGYVAGKGVVKASGYGGLGQRMLEKMGWQKGQGLGKEKDGMTDALEVKKKEDTLGVGANGSGWDWNWKYWDDAYNSAVKSINHETDSSSDSDSSSDDEEPAVRRAPRAGGPPSLPAVNRDGTLSSASAAEHKLNKALAKDAWGRWGGRGGKMARIREQEAAEAAAMRVSLGLPPLPDTRGGSGGGGSGSSSSSSSDEETGAKESRRASGRAAGTSAGTRGGDAGAASAVAAAEEKKQLRKKPMVVVLKIKDDPSIRRVAFKPTPATGWWGAKYFTSAGAMANLEDEVEERKKEEEKDGFDEGDQEALYMRLHNTQRVGRRGMGKSDTLKISGGKWEGSKTTFEEGDGGSGGVGAVMALTAVVGGDPDAEPSAGGENKGKKAKKAKSSKQPATGAAAATETTTKKSKRAKMPEQPAAEAEPAAEPATRLSKKAKGLEPAAEAATVSKKAGTSEQLVAEASATAAAAKKDRKSKRGMQVPSDGPSLQKGKEDGNAAGVAIAVEAAVTGISTHEQPCRKWVKVARKLLKKAPERRLRARALMEQLREHCVGSANQLTSPGSRSDLRKALTGNGKARMAMEGKYVVLLAGCDA